jgi:hypothetical protein
MTATAAGNPCSSVSRNPRPCAGATPSTLNTFAVTFDTFTRSALVSEVSVARPHFDAARPSKVRWRAR